MLFVIYLAYIMVYVSFRPIGGNEFHQDLQQDSTGIALEITLWTMNIGYILFEVQECTEKGLKEYLNLGVQGQTNIMDVAISIIWIFLLIVRLLFIFERWEFDGQNATILQQIYVFIFGVQIILLTMRALALASNTQYLGTLLRVIKLMIIFKADTIPA